MSDLREQFRQAFRYLKGKHGYTIQHLAEVGKCSTRHIQAALSEKESRGIGGEVGQLIAYEFGLTYPDMLDLGKWILDGHDPDDWGYPKGLARSEEISPEFTFIPKYKARLSGGHGSFETSDQVEANLAFRTEFIRAKGSPDKMAMFEIMGDSMEPFLYDGDVILVDLQQNDPNLIVDGKAYGFREGNIIKVKRLSIQGRALIATSENSQKYPPYEVVDHDQFQLIGRVIWVGHEVR
jgi:hypothetical protein